MAIERTPEEWEQNDRERAYIDEVLARTRANYRTWFVAEMLDEPADVCELWLNRVWNQLRAELDHEQLLMAVLALLEHEVRIAAMVEIGEVT